MKISIKVRQIETGNEWTENYDVENGLDPEQWAEELLVKFNATLRPGESARELLWVEVLEEQSESTINHDWEKQNMYTITGTGAPHDVYKCRICGITGKRHGLGDPIKRDRQYKAMIYETCNGALKQLERNRKRNSK